MDQSISSEFNAYSQKIGPYGPEYISEFNAYSQKLGPYGPELI